MGIADDQVNILDGLTSLPHLGISSLLVHQARDFDFVAAEMKYDSTGMFHWTPSRPIEDCIQVFRVLAKYDQNGFFNLHVTFRTVTRRP